MIGGAAGATAGNHRNQDENQPFGKRKMPNHLLATVTGRLRSGNQTLLYGRLFCLTGFYVVSQAADVFVFHLVADIYLARLAMLAMAGGLALMIRGRVIECLRPLRGLLLIASGWTLYLILNALLGANQRTSFELLLRFIGAWIIAFEIAVLIHATDRKAMTVMGYALIFALLVITLIWQMEDVNSPWFEWLRSQLRNPHSHQKRAMGLYVSPNILGRVLVIHTAILIWYTFHKYISILIIPSAWMISFFGVVKTQSKNALIGIIIGGALALLTYCRLFLSKATKGLKMIVLLSIVALVIAMILVANANSVRLSSMFANIAQVHWGNLDLEDFEKELRIIDDARIQIWQRAFGYWRDRPMTGIGLGSFRYMPSEKFHHAHNFILTLLAEQGLIGLTFLAALLICLTRQMKSWAGASLLACLLYSQLFEDLALYIAFPIYTSLVLGYCLSLVLELSIVNGTASRTGT